MTVREAQNRINAREFAEWIAYDHIEPFGEERADMRAGIISSTIANSVRGRNRRAYKPKDFMPQYDKQTKRQNQGDMMIVWKQFVGAQNAFINDRTKKK